MKARERQLEFGSLRTVAELDACVAIQMAVWGYADGDVLPRRTFVLANHIGGQVFGARVDGELAGFAMALPGVRDGVAYLHSHMLAVLPAYRNLGLGRRLKMVQRDEALGRGIDLMEWTFDPLQAKNAYFNLERLGAVSRRYEPNFYGKSSSPLQRGLETDRLVAQWWLRTERVSRALEGLPSRETATERIEFSGPGESAFMVQSGLREALQDALARGLHVVGFERRPAEGGAYLLARPDLEDVT